MKWNQKILLGIMFMGLFSLVSFVYKLNAQHGGTKGERFKDIKPFKMEDLRQVELTPKKNNIIINIENKQDNDDYIDAVEEEDIGAVTEDPGEEENIEEEKDVDVEMEGQEEETEQKVEATVKIEAVENILERFYDEQQVAEGKIAKSCSGNDDPELYDNLKDRVWPLPTEMTTGKHIVLLSPTVHFSIQLGSLCKEVEDLVRLQELHFKRAIPREPTTHSHLLHTVVINVLTKVECGEACSTMNFDYPDGENEEYWISIGCNGEARIRAKSYFGLIRAFESLRQMVTVIASLNSREFQFFNMVETIDSPRNDMFIISGAPVYIKDSPRFAYRGLLLDVARNIFPMDTIYRIVDILSTLKMNVLHLHFSDDQGFVLKSKLFSTISLGTTYKGRTYTQEDIVGLIKYARNKGIRIVPEFGMPGHAGGWSRIPEILSMCKRFACSDAWSISLKPTANTFNITSILINELSALFPDPLIHLGGDEVVRTCWNEIGHELGKSSDWWQVFETGITPMINELRSKGKRIVRWEDIIEHFGNPTQDMALGDIFQVWVSAFDQSQVLKKQLPSIVSRGWYLNWNAASGQGCKSFEECYHLPLGNTVQENLMGGEACAWEMSRSSFLHSGIGYQIISVSESLWGNLSRSVADAKKRSIIAGKRIEQIIPSFCTPQKSAAELLRAFQEHEGERDSLLCYRISNGTIPCSTRNCVRENLAYPEINT